MKLVEKLYRIPFDGNADEQSVTWQQFCRDQLPEQSFTFWDWFYASMKLTSNFVKKPWNAGLIHGFISKHQTEAMLNESAPGTFICRFSESKLGNCL